jgi:hypothetical protein
MEKRIKELSKLLDSKTLTSKDDKKNIDEKKLSEEFKRFSQINNRVDERLNEGMFDAQGGTEMTKGGSTPAPYSMKYTQAGMKHYPGYGKTVNTFLPDMDSQFYGAASTLNSSEALCVAITRAINSGAPVNNMSLYQEVNWNLNNMGFESVQPIEIKEVLKKMIKK